ncbi:MAG: ester cyclase [Haloglomus sp.]
MSEPDATSDDEAVVRRWFEELFNEHELAVADEIVAPDLEYRGPKSLSPQDATGPADIKEFVETYRDAFPDLQYVIEDVSVGGGEVRVRWSATGTHERDLYDIESTGEQFWINGIGVFVVEDGRITEVDAQWDTLKLVQELGVVSEF